MTNKLTKKVKEMFFNRKIGLKSCEGIYPIGPSDAPVAKISDVYRKVIYVKTKEYRTLVLLKDKLEGFMKDNRLYQNVAVGFEFNPIN